MLEHALGIVRKKGPNFRLPHPYAARRGALGRRKTLFTFETAEMNRSVTVTGQPTRGPTARGGGGYTTGAGIRPRGRHS